MNHLEPLTPHSLPHHIIAVNLPVLDNAERAEVGTLHNSRVKWHIRMCLWKSALLPKLQINFAGEWRFTEATRSTTWCCLHFCQHISAPLETLPGQGAHLQTPYILLERGSAFKVCTYKTGILILRLLSDQWQLS